MLDKERQRGLRNIYFMHSVQGFAMALVGIFIPIYLLTLDYTVRETILFFLAHYGAVLVFTFVAIYLAKWIGLQNTIIARIPLVLLHIILLFLLPGTPVLIFVLPVTGGSNTALYWIPLHILFAKNTANDKVGSDTGKLMAFPELLGLFAPMIGGLVAAFLGFQVLLAAVFIILCISIYPWVASGFRGMHFRPTRMLSIPHLGHAIGSFYHNIIESVAVKSSFEFSLQRGLRIFRNNPRYFVAEVFENMGEEVEAIIWPIVVFLSLSSIESVGYVGTLLALGSIIFTLLIGRLSDKFPKRRIMAVGSLFVISIWLARYFFTGELAVYMTTLAIGFFTVLMLVPFTSWGYSLPKSKEIDEFFVFREIPVAVGRLAIMGLALLFVSELQIMFVAAAIAYLCFLFIVI